VATLQSRVDRAVSGATLDIPACIFRESVHIDRPLVLRAKPGAQIRGTDVWDSWRHESDGWHGGTLPPFQRQPAQCQPGTERCLWPEQVFRDDIELAQVAERPGPGEFAVTTDRTVVLGDDPAGHVIEVATRDTWIRVAASDVRIEGFRMRGAVAPAQTGGVTIGQPDGPTVDRVAIVRNDLSAAHGALISILSGRGHVIDANRLTEAGDLGIAAVRPAADVTIRGNVIAGNNTQGFDPGWEAGGIKTLFQEGLVVTGNRVHDNFGRGIWTDTDTSGATIEDNRVWANAYAGIFVEASRDVAVDGNVAWDNGWAPEGAAWGFGGGITLSSSDHVSVSGNTVAWNADGITILSQDRPDDRDHVGIDVADNVIVQAPIVNDPRSTYVLAWLADWNGPLFGSESGNTSRHNGIWELRHDDPAMSFAWDGTTHALEVYERRSAGQGDHYLTVEERDAALAAADIPFVPSAEHFPPARPGGSPQPGEVGVALGVALAGLLAVGLALFVKRHRRAGAARPGGPTADDL
jgi:nitrous oxidase accessory protein NosD